MPGTTASPKQTIHFHLQIYFFLDARRAPPLGSSSSGGFGAAFALAFALAGILAPGLLGNGFAFGKGIAFDRDSSVKASWTLSFQAPILR